ncbi:glycosidase [Oceanotoga teriensis]|jgi:glycosidase|uniref:Glycosidase n=1 Tax=Oceanotoga teriensis TaxID=515440 RepID=A0AA45C8U8_9BACT|nr:alpha-amylase family glycosyl hydrolase [Oceanotoga teriensis]PWJ96461.1 glycosidase [Oceanotoga teriensis]
MFIGYHILVKFFYNGDSENDFLPNEYRFCESNSVEGDLKGIIDNFDYIKELGVDLIYLAPIFKSDTTHGYDTVNYFKLATHIFDKNEFKSQKLLHNFINLCHSNDIKVIFDLVLNHVSKFYEMETITQFRPVTENPKTPQENRWQRLFKFWNVEDLETKKFLISVGKYWVEKFNIDGYRLDHAIGLPIEFWSEFYIELKNINKDIILLGEVWDDISDSNDNYKLIKHFKEFDGNTTFTSLFDFYMYDSIIEFFAEDKINNSQFFNRIIKSYSMNNKNFKLTYFMENHDLPRFINICRDYKKFEMVLKFLFTLSGNLMFEYGNEIGIQGDITYKNFHESGRVSMKFKDNHSIKEKYLFDLFKKLVNLRKNNKSLFKGNYILKEDKDVLIFDKVYNEDKFMILVNKNDNYLLEGTYFDELTEEYYEDSFFEKGVYILSYEK